MPYTLEDSLGSLLKDFYGKKHYRARLDRVLNPTEIHDHPRKPVDTIRTLITKPVKEIAVSYNTLEQLVEVWLVNDILATWQTFQVCDNQTAKKRGCEYDSVTDYYTWISMQDTTREQVTSPVKTDIADKLAAYQANTDKLTHNHYCPECNKQWVCIAGDLCQASNYVVRRVDKRANSWYRDSASIWRNHNCKEVIKRKLQFMMLNEPDNATVQPCSLNNNGFCKLPQHRVTMYLTSEEGLLDIQRRHVELSDEQYRDRIERRQRR